MDKAKPFCISKREVWEAYKRVKANHGSAGIDGQSIEEFEGDLNNNLYRLWNRMSSGSYLPPPVRRVDIPKGDGRTRPLGIPTVSDRIAQMVVKRYLEPILEPVFHEDSYGYRPGRSAHNALSVARQRCWNYDWVLDLDIKGFFDNIDWALMLRALRKHTQCKWALLYIERWLRATVCMPDGTLVNREKGTPQGGVISPLLSNLFLHYVFDIWITKYHPQIRFERYADDVICHCSSEGQARELYQALEQRFAVCGLELHPQKTKIAYCKDSNRPGSYAEQEFDFLGYTFRPREAMNRKGEMFISFSPAVSDKAAKAMRGTIRHWRLHNRSDLELDDLARWTNPVMNGWVRYYGLFHPSVLQKKLRTFDFYLMRWARHKYKRLKRSRSKAWDWLTRLRSRQPDLFPLWAIESSVG
ncbi:group II intron reverse transcriptase/maturase [Ferrovum sp.]|uniref:group II intron reverse transcriptase/maturase n=1 Tax=Ferrovum sp. TaxID=2609467 RepID=UPI00263233D8|nr:group II intron reverse transcriptase/maturase [Ferrovum sp.]